MTRPASTEIYYFSGSGNTLHVARELQRRLAQARLVPIASLLDRETIEVHAGTVGLLFPIQGLTAPIPIRMFLKKARFTADPYIFCLATRGGSRCVALDYVARKLRRVGRKLDAGFILTMHNNDPKLEAFEDITEQEVAAMEAAVQDKLDTVQQVVVNRQSHRDEDLDGVTFPYSAPVNYLLERLIVLGVVYAEHGGVRDYFEATADCVGCGTCEKVCLSSRVKMVDKRPVWQQDVQCYLCYSCLNYCPAQAVQIRTKWYMKSYTRVKGRYSHPFATADEIAEQKRATLHEEHTSDTGNAS